MRETEEKPLKISERPGNDNENSRKRQRIGEFSVRDFFLRFPFFFQMKFWPDRNMSYTRELFGKFTYDEKFYCKKAFLFSE
jgi:hypothetical protein